MEQQLRPATAHLTDRLAEAHLQPEFLPATNLSWQPSTLYSGLENEQRFEDVCAARTFEVVLAICDPLSKLNQTRVPIRVNLSLDPAHLEGMSESSSHVSRAIPRMLNAVEQHKAPTTQCRSYSAGLGRSTGPLRYFNAEEGIPSELYINSKMV